MMLLIWLMHLDERWRRDITLSSYLWLAVFLFKVIVTFFGQDELRNAIFIVQAIFALKLHLAIQNEKSKS